MKDKQGEITVVDELYKVLPIWIDRGAPITDTHSNRVIGKGINFAKTTVTSDGVTYPAIKITGKIHKNYELDTDIWEKIKSGEYKGLSFGGATKANRIPKVMKDGEIAYALTDLEHYEVAVCKDPAVPLALITEFNTLAKATIPSEPRGDGKEIIRCDKFGCYVTKYEGKDEPEYHDESLIKGGEDWSNADIIPATVTNTVSQSTQVAKPIKTDTKVGKPEREGGLKLNVTPLEGGIKPPSETNKEFPIGTGGGVRAHIDDASNQDNPKDQTVQVSEKIERIHKAGINKVIGAILAGAQRIKATDTKGGNQFHQTDSENIPRKEPQTKWWQRTDDEESAVEDKKVRPPQKEHEIHPSWKAEEKPKKKKKEPLLSNSWEALRAEWFSDKASPTTTESENAILDPDEDFIEDTPENAEKMQVIHDRTERARASVARGKKTSWESWLEKKDNWDKEEKREDHGLRRQSKRVAVRQHVDEEVGSIGTKQRKDEERAVRSGKIAPSRTITVSGGGDKGINVQDPKHSIDVDLLHELKAIEEIRESMKSLGALGWGKLNRDGTKQKLRKKQPKIDDFVEEKNKFAYATEEGNIQLGGQAVPTEKEKLVSSLGAQNKQTKVTIREKSDFCPNCGKGISERQHKDYPETQAKGAYCPSCRQNKQIKERDAKDEAKMEEITAGIHRDLSARGQKVTRFSAGKPPKRSWQDDLPT